MIIGNTLKFGYGDIAVGSCKWTHRIFFYQLVSPANCGDEIDNRPESDEEKIEIDLTCEECKRLTHLLCDVEKKTSFEFKGYIFNFDNYNADSVKVCKEHLQQVMSYYSELCAV